MAVKYFSLCKCLPFYHTYMPIKPLLSLKGFYKAIFSPGIIQFKLNRNSLRTKNTNRIIKNTMFYKRPICIFTNLNFMEHNCAMSLGERQTIASAYVFRLLI